MDVGAPSIAAIRSVASFSGKIQVVTAHDLGKLAWPCPTCNASCAPLQFAPERLTRTQTAASLPAMPPPPRPASPRPASPRPASPRIAAILLAAGKGIRFGADTPKQFLPIAGRPVLRHAAEALARDVALLQPVGDPEQV